MSHTVKVLTAFARKINNFYHFSSLNLGSEVDTIAVDMSHEDIIHCC